MLVIIPERLLMVGLILLYSTINGGAVVDSNLNNLILRRRLQNSSSLIIIYSMLFYNITASIATRGDANAYSDVVRDLCSFTC